MRITSQEKMLLIQIQNYYDSPLKFENGLPITTKSDRSMHGYGMKSIRYTAEKYNGAVNVTAEAGIFTLQILLPAS